MMGRYHGALDGSQGHASFQTEGFAALKHFRTMPPIRNFAKGQRKACETSDAAVRSPGLGRSVWQGGHTAGRSQDPRKMCTFGRRVAQSIPKATEKQLRKAHCPESWKYSSSLRSSRGPKKKRLVIITCSPFRRR